MFPLFRRGNGRWLGQDRKMWVAWSGQYTVMSQLIWYTIYWLGTQQYRELVRISRSRVLLSLHTSPRCTWALTSQGRVSQGESISPDTKGVVFPPIIHFPTPNGPPPVLWFLIPCLWSQGRCPRLGSQDFPDFRCQLHVFELSCFWISDWNLKFPCYLHAQKLNQTSEQTQENS